MVLCAMGISREDSAKALLPLKDLRMGVRMDRKGHRDWDYHTAGAKIGIRSAEGKLKETATTKEYETLLSRREYLYEASFLVALQGEAETILACAHAMEKPVWPLYLGRKCCIPSEPVFQHTGHFDGLESALASVPWQSSERSRQAESIRLDAYLEHPKGTPPPENALCVHDVPQVFGYYGYAPRWIVPTTIETGILKAEKGMDSGFSGPRLDYNSEKWREAREKRLVIDSHLCVFCKSPATDVHHVSYERAGREKNEDLRSLCKTCHDACTQLEYSHDLQTFRIDPLDPALRPALMAQITKLVQERRMGLRRRALEAGRSRNVFFESQT
jgi:CRISPR system Cascade subunit CasD